MRIEIHIPAADVLGFDRTRGLFKRIEQAALNAADTSGVSSGFFASWEPEALSRSWSDPATPEPQSLRVVP